MLKRVILHIGLRKTGTTSFQNTCYHGINSLLDNEIAYPLIKLNSEKKLENVNFTHIKHRPNSQNPLFYQKRLKLYGWKGDMEKIIHENPCPKGTLLISSENIFQHLEIKEIMELKTFFEHHAHQVDLFVTIRNPYNFIPSLHQQLVKVSPNEASTQKKLILECNKIESLILADKSIKIIIFEELVKHPKGLSYAMAEKMDLPLNIFEKELPLRNESISTEAARLISHIDNIAELPRKFSYFLYFKEGYKYSLHKKSKAFFETIAQKLINVYEEHYNYSYPKDQTLRVYDHSLIWSNETIKFVEKYFSQQKDELYREMLIYALRKEADTFPKDDIRRYKLIHIAHRLSDEDTITAAQKDIVPYKSFMDSATFKFLSLLFFFLPSIKKIKEYHKNMTNNIIS